MAWNGDGSFTRDNGTNTGATVWADDAAAGTKILSTLHDVHDEAIATGLEACLTKNMETKPTADFVPATTTTYDLGTTSLKWEDLHLNGDALIGGTLGVTGVFTLTGGQIAFPATQSASADANTLDDYEEGTWTPTLEDTSYDSGEGQTYALQAGAYTKIGRIVFIEGRIQMSDLGTLTTSAHANIGSLPFTQATTNSVGAVSIGSAGSLSITQFETVSGYVESNTDRIELFKWDATTGTSNFLVSDMTASGLLRFSGHYVV